MEQVAFRRNLADPQTILEFAQRFASPELLDELFVLTYADLSAVNRNVLTEWKSSLLHELYRKAREVIVSRATHDEVVSRTQEERESAERLVVKTLRAALPEKLVRNHLALMEDPSYVTSFSPEEIREHLEMVIHRPLVRSQFRTAGDVTEVTVVARDAPFALARFCGVLSANDANILDAGIYTRRDGIIIDRFRVADFVTRSCLGADQCERIQQELDDVFHSRTEIQDLLARHRAKWKRRSVPVNPNIRLDAAFEEHPHYTIIDVFAADTLGFLYRITETLSRLGLNIAFAKISSRTDGIVDSFYVTDEHGRRITEEAHKEAIRQEVMQTVRETAEKELVIG
jgi:[protein-PII] uridylyltransferase